MFCTVVTLGLTVLSFQTLQQTTILWPRTGVYVPVVEPGMPTDVSKKNKPTFTFRIGSIPRTPPMQAEALEPAAELVVDGE